MSKGRRYNTPVVLAAVAFVAMILVQGTLVSDYRAIMKTSSPESSGEAGELMLQLPGQFIVASMTGFKEVVAGTLWVRADTFFHKGQYHAIVPIVRLVTWLDPHNIDVFTTGAWHLDYNFVDDLQMSDKRYIPASIALLKEGIKHNPNIWDLYFELAWTHYNKKLEDHKAALEYFQEACKRDGVDPNTGRKTERPEYVDRMLAHQYEKLGMFDEAEKQWFASRKRVEDMMKNRKGVTTFVDQNSIDVCDRNLCMLYLRKAWRYGDMEWYSKGVKLAQELKSRGGRSIEAWAADGAAADFARRTASGAPPKDALRPLNTGFEVSWKRLKPKVLLIQGKINVVSSSEYKTMASECFTHYYQDNLKADANEKEFWRDGSRVHWMLTDYDYKMPEIDTFSWKIDTTRMVVWDTLYVSGGAFGDKIDLSINDEFYPFKADKYRLTVWFSPIQPGCPDYCQDRIGWKGDAIVDKSEYIDTTTTPGFRMLRKEFIIDRKDLI